MTELNINGRKHDVKIEPGEKLSDLMHDKMGLLGVRVSCSEGECGSCTVLMDGKPVTSCLVLAEQAEGKEILSIEGLGAPDDLHPIQQAFIEEQGFQCGFCTPGFILTAKAFLDKKPDPSAEEVAMGISGNICRCGAYPYIVKSVLNAARKIQGSSSKEPSHGE